MSLPSVRCSSCMSLLTVKLSPVLPSKSIGMKMGPAQELCKNLQTITLAKGYSDAIVGLVLIFCIQLLVVPIQIVLTLHSINLPASILVMFLVLITMTIASGFTGEVMQFYQHHLRGPTDFLGRHMSFGFVAFFVLLNRDHIRTSSDIPRIAGVFTVTAIISYMAAFLFASGAFHVEQRLRRSRQCTTDLESNNKIWPSPSIAWPAPPSYEKPKRISQLSSLSEALSTNEPSITITPIPSTLSSWIPASINFIVRTATLWIWLFLLIAFGIPVYVATGYIMPFEVFLFTLLWVLSLRFQRSMRSSYGSSQFRRIWPSLFILANPVILTWGLASAYMWAKTLHTGRNIDSIIGEFRHHTSFSECIIHIMKDHDVHAHLGAGDLASLLLDAGVACLGFKMYEYRSELWVSLGTVSFTCVALAVINVFLNVLVGRGFGLQGEDAIAFTARSATLALGMPAIENLGGSTTLTSTVAIFNGILFQLVGDWLFSLMRINDRAPSGVFDQSQKISVPAGNPTLLSPESAVGSVDTKSGGNYYGAVKEESPVVAAGVTVGINAAAMGTVYLIERDSRATAYSALSMIVFGVATVALTALPGVAGAVTLLVSR